MVDSGGAVLSLMYLPATSLNVPAPSGAIIQLTPVSRAALGLAASWNTALTIAPANAATGSAKTLVLCAVYSLGQTPGWRKSGPSG
jgi:hypothetical protein